MDFHLVSSYQPTGDQPEAIKQLVAGLKKQEASQTLLGVTGSGKTLSSSGVASYIFDTENSNIFFQKTRLNILYLITIITNLRLSLPPQVPT